MSAAVSFRVFRNREGQDLRPVSLREAMRRTAEGGTR